MIPSPMLRAARVPLAAALALPLVALAPATPSRATESGAAAVKSAESRVMARVDRRIADLHARLHITAAEDPQWQQFASVMRDNAQKMGQIFSDRAKNFGSYNAVENMKSYARIAQQHAQNMQHLAAAFENLYDVLSPEQKKTADEVFRSHAQRRREQHKSR